MDLSSIKGIIFDAEGVVVDTEILWDKSQDILLEKRGLEYDRDYLKPRMAGQTLLEGARLMVEYYKLDEDPSIIAQERNVLIHDLFENNRHLLFVYDFMHMWTFYVEIVGEEKPKEGTSLPAITLSMGQRPEEAPEKDFEGDKKPGLFDDAFGEEDLDEDNY